MKRTSAIEMWKFLMHRMELKAIKKLKEELYRRVPNAPYGVERNDFNLCDRNLKNGS